MAQINCGTLYGYQNNNTAYGAFTVYFTYDGTTRNGTTVTITNPRVICTEYAADGYTTNTIFINSVTLNGTSLDISGSFKGSDYWKGKSWTSTGVGTKNVSADASLTSLTVSISCGRSGAQYNQTLTGTISVAAGNYTVSYNANGGYVSTPKLTQYNTTSYSFKSWNTNSSGTGTTYNSGGSYTANADVTLYAIWNTSITKGSVTLPTPARAHYSFVGWGTTASATTGVTGTITPTSSQTLYAVWERTPSLINWRDSNGNFTSGGTISIKDSNGRWVVINKLNIKNSSGVFEEH